jgi:hypothetical protein
MLTCVILVVYVRTCVAQMQSALNVAIVGFGPDGIAFDNNGDLFVSNHNSRTISKITTTGTSLSVNNYYLAVTGGDASNNITVVVVDNTGVSHGFIQKYDSFGNLVADEFGGNQTSLGHE